MAGDCSVKLAAWLEDRSVTAPEPKVIPFLRDGHHLQTGVEKFLREFCQVQNYRFPYSFSLERAEPYGSLVSEEHGVQLNCKVDGLFRKPGHILEVKCVKDKQFKKLLKTDDWRTVYPNYVDSAQVYLAVPYYIMSGKMEIPGPFLAVNYVFKNRDTSEMLGGIPFKHPAYTYREDMVETPDKDILEEVLTKLQRVAQGESSDKCDAEGYCYFCKSKGSRPPSKPSTSGWKDGVWEGLDV